jgi:hypothetical protein
VRLLKLVPLSAAVVLSAAAPAGARTVDDVDVIASGLDNPRHVAASPGGDVYVLEIELDD